MIACVAVAGDGLVDPRWGRADKMAVAEVEEGAIASWEEYEVHWGMLHDQGSERRHHARVAQFIRQHHVEVVLARHIGGGMQNVLDTMGVKVRLGIEGDARRAVEALAAG